MQRSPGCSPDNQVGRIINGPDLFVGLLGLLGLINGLVGVRDNDWGYIAMDWDPDAKVALRYFFLPPAVQEAQ